MARMRLLILGGLGMMATLATLAPALATTAEVPSPQQLLDELKAPGVDFDRAVAVSGLRLSVDRADMLLGEGWLIPATTLSGRVVEAVFVGSGRLRLEPPDATEAAQLEIYTGEQRVDRTFDAAVLVVPNDSASQGMFRRVIAPLPAERRDRVATLWKRWRESAERRALGVDALLLADGLGEQVFASAFVTWMLSGEENPILLQIDPTAEEPLSVGRFMPLEATEREKRKLQRALRSAKRSGRGLGVELVDLGDWEQWLSAPLGTRQGKPIPRQTLFESVRYVLDVKVSGSGEPLMRGTAQIVLRALTKGHRVVAVGLHRDFEVESVRDVRGQELPRHRSGSTLAVVLGTAPNPGDDVVIEVHYRGRFFEHDGRSFYSLRDTLAWYPHVGSLDRATYDVTLTWPRRLSLIAAGERLDGGDHPDETRWERRQLRRPSIGFSFEIGSFDVERAVVRRPDAAPVQVEVYFDDETTLMPKAVRREIVEAVTDSLSYYGDLFGSYPEDGLRVVTVPRASSQGLPGFITLSEAAMADLESIWRTLLGISDRRTTVAHEVAHQWWGNRVAWSSYHDQWISEAMANYCALLWSRHRLPAGEKPAIGPTANWKAELLATTSDGRTIESLGPVTLGLRLLGKEADAYDAIVYKKGAVVLDMLSRQWQEKDFLVLLRQLVDAASGKVLSTADFLAAIERLSGASLGGFAKRFIYGTGLPEVHYEVELLPRQGEKWPVKLRSTQRSRYRFSYRLAAAGDGRIDVVRERVDDGTVDDTSFVVPFQIPVDAPWPAGAPPPPKPKKGEPPARPQLEGRLVLRGPQSAMDLEVDHRPLGMILDGRDEVFATFFNLGRSPKRAALRKAQEAASAGDRPKARELFDSVLSAAVRVPAEYARSDSPDELEREGRGLDAVAHLGLARLALEQAGLEAARRELETAVHVLKTSERVAIEGERVVLEARIALSTGDAKEALRLLRRAVLSREVLDDTEGWLLLAVAARAAGEKEELDRALEVATARNVDVALLRQP